MKNPRIPFAAVIPLIQRPNTSLSAQTRHSSTIWIRPLEAGQRYASYPKRKRIVNAKYGFQNDAERFRMNPTLQNAVLDFIREQWPIETKKKKKISLDRSLNVDLGMDGDDAVEFFEAFAEKFNVDLTELGEEWNLYFAPEGVSFWGPSDGCLTLFTASPPPRNCPALPLSIERLVHSAETGRWEKLSTA